MQLMPLFDAYTWKFINELLVYEFKFILTGKIHSLHIKYIFRQLSKQYW